MENDIEAVGEVTVVGTVHVSKDSIKRVEETISEKDPDVVAVELGMPRFKEYMKQREMDTEPEPPSIREAVSSSDIELKKYAVSRGLWEIQDRLADEMGMAKSGGDLRTAVETTLDGEYDLALIDRTQDETMDAFVDELSKFEMVKMAGSFVFTMGTILFKDSEDTVQELENSEEERPIGDIIKNAEKHFPTFYNSFIHERNVYLADSIRKLREEGYDTVAVVGRGHKDAVESYLDSSMELESDKKSTGVNGEAVIIEWAS